VDGRGLGGGEVKKEIEGDIREARRGGGERKR
jgi:hypothetical protein